MDCLTDHQLKKVLEGFPENETENQSVEIFNFNANGNNAPAYSCNKPYDNSGDYVKLEDYNRLQARLHELEQ